jgi:hypothetical protein
LLAVIIVMGSGASAWSAEIPSHLDASPVDPAQAADLLQQAGLPHDVAVAHADSLDPVELAQLGQSDLEQKGGDPLTFTIVVVAVVILGLMWIFTVCEP